MFSLQSPLLWASFTGIASAQSRQPFMGDPSLSPNGKYIMLPATPPTTSSGPIAPAFVSFSIEFASFPDYAGNLSHPNLYSDNLLENIAAYQGVKPIIRVGGHTQYVF